MREYINEVFEEHGLCPPSDDGSSDDQAPAEEVGATKERGNQAYKLPWHLWLKVTRRVTAATDGKIQQDKAGCPTTLSY